MFKLQRIAQMLQVHIGNSQRLMLQMYNEMCFIKVTQNIKIENHKD